MTIHGKKISVCARGLKFSTQLNFGMGKQILIIANSQTNSRASTIAQTSLFPASYKSYHIWSKYSTHVRILKITTDVMDWFLILPKSYIILIDFYLR